MDGCRYLWTYPQSHLTACVDCNVAHSLLHHTSTGDWLENGNSIDTEEPLTNVRGSVVSREPLTEPRTLVSGFGSCYFPLRSGCLKLVAQ